MKSIFPFLDLWTPVLFLILYLYVSVFQCDRTEVQNKRFFYAYFVMLYKLEISYSRNLY